MGLMVDRCCTSVILREEYQVHIQLYIDIFVVHMSMLITMVGLCFFGSYC